MWWQEDVWKSSAAQLPAIVVNLLEPLRRLIAALEVELKTRTKEVEAAAPARTCRPALDGLTNVDASPGVVGRATSAKTTSSGSATGPVDCFARPN